MGTRNVSNCSLKYCPYCGKLGSQRGESPNEGSWGFYIREDMGEVEETFARGLLYQCTKCKKIFFLTVEETL